MDYGAGFLVGLQTPLFGSYPTRERPRGTLYVSGAEDFRAQGVHLLGGRQLKPLIRSILQ